MVNKYERQQDRLDESVKDGLKRGENKSKLIQLLKQKKIVIQYMNICYLTIIYYLIHRANM